MKEAGVAAVKLEGGAEMAPQIERLTEGGIPVCAHIGFTPSTNTRSADTGCKDVAPPRIGS